MEERPRINVNFSYTKNMGNFESAKIEMGIQRDLLEREDSNDALLEEVDILRELVKEEHIKTENFWKT